jgi:hypothetical protein
MIYFENGKMSAAEIQRSSYTFRDLLNPELLNMIPAEKKNGSIFYKEEDVR